jgi:hypothetical protein
MLHRNKDVESSMKIEVKDSMSYTGKSGGWGMFTRGVEISTALFCREPLVAGHLQRSTDEPLFLRSILGLS